MFDLEDLMLHYDEDADYVMVKMKDESFEGIDVSETELEAFRKLYFLIKKRLTSFE